MGGASCLGIQEIWFGPELTFTTVEHSATGLPSIPRGSWARPVPAAHAPNAFGFGPPPEKPQPLSRQDRTGSWRRRCNAAVMMRIRVGCSGWHYTSWRGRLYPPDLPTRRWLAAYAQAFDCVEINSSFYRLPDADTFAAWREQTPRGFVFAVKASRYLTHMLRLTRPSEALERLLDRASRLGPRLGPLLYQLPPRWSPDEARLRAFLELLPRTIETGSRATPLSHVIEFRDERCYTPAMFRLLERYGVSMCVHDMPGSASPRVVIGPRIYVRLHGYEKKYGGDYPPRVLRSWAQWLRRASVDRGGYVFFNNDIEGHAVENARTLRAQLGA